MSGTLYEPSGRQFPHVFSYRPANTLALLGTVILSGVVFAIAALFFLYIGKVQPSAFDANPLLFAAVPAVASVMLFWAAHFHYQRTRPIRIDTETIASLTSTGRIKTAIKWSDITEITKIHRFDFFYTQTRTFYKVQAWNNVIYFDDLIHDKQTLLDMINEQIRMRAIPATCVDGSTDALAEIRRTVSNPAERRQLLRTGRIYKVTSL